MPGSSRGWTRYVRAAKTLQDVLGAHQDSVVAEERLRRVAASHPDAAMAAGRLVDRERRRRARGSGDWRKQWTLLSKQAKKV